MTHDDKAMPRIPLAVVAGSMDSRPDRGDDRGGPALLQAAADERFLVHFLELDAGQVVDWRPEACGALLCESAPVRPGDEIDWAAALGLDDVLLPIEQAGRLRTDAECESFVARVFTCHAWRELQLAGFTLARLQAFFAQRKYLLMSRHIGAYQQVGQLLAQPLPGPAGSRALDAMAHHAITLIMAALRRPATRGGHCNALSHIRGYLKNHLVASENQDLDEAIEWYRLGLVPLSTPLVLLREGFARNPHPYIEQQIYMQPYLYKRFDPAALVAGNRRAAIPAGRADAP